MVNMGKVKRSVFSIVCVGSLIFGSVVPAGAEELADSGATHQVAQAIETLETLEGVGLIERAQNVDPIVVSDGDSAELKAGSFGLKSDAEYVEEIQGRIVAVSDRHNVVYESLDEGDSRAVIQISSPDSPKEYSFELTGEYADLVKRGDGGIDALDADGHTIFSVDAPWAYDADGDAVPTHFEIDGKTIVQVVEHNDSFDYGIVADPTLREHIKKVVGGCLGISTDATSFWGGVIEQITRWDKAVKFVVRRIGVLGAVSCMGGIVWQYI